MTSASTPHKAPRWKGLLLLAATLLLAWGAIAQSGSFFFQNRNPTLALMFDRNDPVALVRKAKADISAGVGDGNGGARVLDAARRSVAQNPLNADAFGLYGLVGMANADMNVISRQVSMADRLSRRDLGTQLFLIEDAVRRNDVAAVLRHYDAAMRIEDSIRPTLYAILTEAMQEPAIRQRFLPYMTLSNPWLESFLRYAVSNSSEPTSIVSLAVEAGGFPDDVRFSTRTRELLSVLVGKGEFASARRLFLTVGEGDPTLLADARFTDVSTDPALAPFTWQPVASESFDPIFVAAPDADLELEARIGPGFAGYVIRKLFALQPGTYTLAVPTRSEGQSPGDTLQWQMSCVGGSSEAVILSADQAMVADAVAGGGFTVPGGCEFQMLRMTAITGPSMGDVTLTLGSPSLGRR